MQSLSSGKDGCLGRLDFTGGFAKDGSEKVDSAEGSQPSSEAGSFDAGCSDYPLHISQSRSGRCAIRLFQILLSLVSFPRAKQVDPKDDGYYHEVGKS